MGITGATTVITTPTARTIVAQIMDIVPILAIVRALLHPTLPPLIMLTPLPAP